MARIALEKDLQILKNLLLDMANVVDNIVNGAILSMDKLNPELAKRVIEFDDQVDYYENMVSQTALEIIALQQPVAKDLRFIITAIDIAKNLERIADQCVNISYRVLDLYETKEKNIPQCKVTIIEMAKEALYMLESAINAFVTEDTKKAYSVIDYDEIVDRFQKDNIEQIKDCMKGNPELLDIGIDYIIVVQNLERVGDLATNIAEGVIFTMEGRIPKLELKKVKDLKETMIKELPIFDLLKKHAHLVLECTERVYLSLEAYHSKNIKRLEEIAKHIFEIEKEADQLKRNIREHLPKGIILPVERFELFMYLKEQDAIADAAEKILNWLSFKYMEIPEELFKKIEELLTKSIDSLKYLENLIVYSANFLINRNEESKNEAKNIIRNIRYSQYLAEGYGNKIKKELFTKINDPLSLFYILNLIDLILQIPHHAENTADLMRAMIAK